MRMGYSAYPHSLSSKAIRELDYQLSPVQDCIDDALNWYRGNGYDI